MATQTPPRAGNGLALTGMILGIVSVISFLIGFISLPAGIAGVVFSIFGMRRAKATGTGRGMAIAGLVLSILGLILFVGLCALIWMWKDLSNWMGQSYMNIRNGGSAPASSPSQHLPASPLLRNMMHSTGG